MDKKILNTYICETCELSSDFGKEISREVNDTEGYITFEHGTYHGSIEDEDTYWCNNCIK
jgi:ADP-glucose pyrophosphorylase|tara:strand:+ start:71 stop:250 length:180 start_codon:yes stop_codon:yes gene_type:complete